MRKEQKLSVFSQHYLVVVDFRKNFSSVDIEGKLILKEKLQINYSIILALKRCGENLFIITGENPPH